MTCFATSESILLDQLVLVVAGLDNLAMAGKAPNSSRNFLHAAEQRLATAEFLILNKGNTLDAYYLTGYGIECSMKALILHLTPEPDKGAKLKEITAGAKWHRFEVLAGELKTLGVRLPPELSKRFRRFSWTTSLRYETGRKPTGEANGFLKTAVNVKKWVEDQIQ